MNLDLTRIFVKVVQNGSFSKAASVLGVPKSTVSKAISRLEKETGTKLLLRTTRSLTLTAAGRSFYDTSLGPLQILEDAQKSLHGKDSILSGVIRLTAPEDLGSNVIAPAVVELMLKHPGLTFDLHYTDTVIDLVKEGFDMAIRIGRITESNFKIKRIGSIALVPVASPNYLKNSKPLKKPQDLINHQAIAHYSLRHNHRWALRSAKNTVQAAINIRSTSNQMTSILKMCLAHGGVGLVPHFLAGPFIETGELVRVLPDWKGPEVNTSMITPLGTSSSARLKITSDHIFKKLTNVL